MNFNFDKVSPTALSLGDFSSVFTASGSVEYIAYVIDEVIEFRSKDGSKVFKPWNNDTIVSTVSYPLSPSIIWNPMTIKVNNDGTSVLNATTTDGRHSYQWTIAKQFASLDNGAILTPNSTKLDVQIKYPFEARDTNLAIRMIMFTASATGASDASVDMSRREVKPSSGNTYMSWVGNANTKLGLVNVEATTDSSLDGTYFDTSKNLLNSLKSKAEAGGKVNVKLNVQYFSFPITSDHEFLYWDPVIGSQLIIPHNLFY